MKKILIFILLFSLVGCKNTNNTNLNKNNNDTTNDTLNDTKEDKPQEIQTITLNEYGYMNETNQGYYELIYNDEITFNVNDDYLIDMFALEFEEKLNVVHYETCHLSGEFRYTYNNKNYITKLNEINIGFFYMGESGKDFFQIDVKDNQIRYWMYSKGKATLTINKIWKFVPYNNIEGE